MHAKLNYVEFSHFGKGDIVAEVHVAFVDKALGQLEVVGLVAVQHSGLAKVESVGPIEQGAAAKK